MTRWVVVGLVLLTACSGGDEGGGVEMTPAQAFEPERITITVGDTVTWDNASSEQHTVTAVESSLPDAATYFASGDAATEDQANDELSEGLLGPGASFTHTFESPGTYRYYCIPHEGAGMRGTVVVEES